MFNALRAAAPPLLIAFLAPSAFAQSPLPAPPSFKLLYSPSNADAGSQPATMVEFAPGLFSFMSYGDSSPTGSSVWFVTSKGSLTDVFPGSSSQPFHFLSFVQGSNGELLGDALPYTYPLSGNPYYLSMSPSGKDQHQTPTAHQGNSIFLTAAPTGYYDIIGYLLQQGSQNATWEFSYINQKGEIKSLFTMNGTGRFPLLGSNIVYGPDGNIYGLQTVSNSLEDPSWIFRLTPSGQYSKIATIQPPFQANGPNPLAFGPDGNIYGTIYPGGTNNTGGLWRATMSGSFEIIASFPRTGMKQPESIMAAGDGNLYGTTQNNYVFQYNLTTQTLKPVAHFPQLVAPYPQCPCQLLHGSDGKFYGITPVGGNSPGVGAVFSFDIGIGKPKPVIQQMVPSSGAAGAQVVIWGGWLIGATEVTFNGVPAASFKVTSSQSIIATVPEGASTGPIAVTTPGGAFTTTANFTVN